MTTSGISTSDMSPAKIGWLEALSPRFFRTPTVMVLIAANLLPLYGVLAWGWDLYSLMVLYWMETGIIGAFAIIQMGLAARWLALFLVPFFIVHFGGFMAGHILFLTIMFGGGGPDHLSRIPDVVRDAVLEHGLWVALVALAISHGVSFVFNVLRPWWRRLRKPAPPPPFRAPQPRAPAASPRSAAAPQNIMLAPYSRIVILHVTILVGAMLVEIFRTKVAAFVLLIVLKTVVDLAAHVRKNFQAVTTAQ